MSEGNTLIGAVIVALAVAAIAVTSLTIFPPPAHAQRLLTAAAEQQTVVKTHTYVISSGRTPQTDDDPTVFTSTVTGYVVAEEGVYLKVQTTLGYVEYLVLPDNQYERDGPDDPWTKISGSASDFELPKLDSTAHANVLSNLEDVTVAGKERLRDIDVTKITARTNMERKAEQIWGDFGQMSDQVRQGVDTPRNQMIAGEEEFVAWVGKDDGLIYQYSAYGSYLAYGNLKAYEDWQTVTFSDFNEPFDIPSATDTGTGSADDGDDGADPTAVPTPLPTAMPVPTVEPTPERKDAPSK